jgi:hypothetical protein
VFFFSMGTIFEIHSAYRHGLMKLAFNNRSI